MNDQNLLIRESRSVTLNTPVFSVFIPTWNNLSYLKLCIDSLRKHSILPLQIIVHINEGTDGTTAWVKSQADLNFTFSQENIGVCYALNQCRTLAKGDYFLYLNDDMYVCPGWDRCLFDEINAIGQDAFFLSATAIEPVETGNDCVIVLNFGADPESFQEENLLKEFRNPVKRDWQGSTWPPNVVHKNTWDMVGGYSIEYSPGLYSDPDFSMKLWKAGIRLFKGVGKSRVYHFGGKSTERVVKNKGYYTFISKWGMTSGTFKKKILRSGEPFDGILAEPVFSFSVKAKNWFKRLLAVLKS
ncbi:MAG TPA: glycosyltransferase family 2 protein [Puia sp.]|nr:glycosyltransferase family 2 protein [Puia sp.]